MAVALYPGAFKPPHRGHFEVVQGLLKGNHGGHIYTKDSGADAGAKALAGHPGKVDKIDKVVIFLGGGERNGITKEESKAIWEIYGKYLGNIEIVDGQKNPMMEAKEYAKAHPDQHFYAVTGVRGEQDFADLRRISTFASRPNVEGLVIPSAEGAGVRATDFRNAILKGSLDDVLDFFPKQLSRQEILKIMSMLKQSIIAEMMAESIDKVFSDLFEGTKHTSENSSGTPITPSSAVRSDDRQKLEYLYNYLKNLIPSDTYITFHPDKLVVSLEPNTPYDGKTVYEGVDTNKLTKYIGSILEYMIDEGMNIHPLPEVKIKRDTENAANFFGKTAYYEPNLKEVVLYVEGRHPKDICRSFVHEMIHHIQNLEGRLTNVSTTNTNEDGNLLELEKEAYLKGNITFRNWEDKIKNQPKEEVIKEDSKYDEYEELASELAESLTRMFQRSGEGAFTHIMDVKREIEGRPFEFSLEVVLAFDKDVETFEGQGYAYAGEEEDEDEDEDYFYMEEDSITIHVVVNPNLKRKFEVMELNLFHFLVHEMEHLVHGEGMNRIDHKFVYEDPFMRSLLMSDQFGDGEEATAEYKILPKEVAAGVKELAARAKATGNTFDEEVEEELDNAKITSPKLRRKVKLAYRKFIGKNELDLEIYV